MNTIATDDLTKILADIAAKNGTDEVTPEMVLEAARPADSPLHHRFIWDDGVAAERFRLAQAAGVIRDARLHVEIKGRRETLRSFISVRTIEPDGSARHAYRQTPTVLNDATLRQQKIAEMLQEAKDWASRARLYEQFAEVVHAITVAEVKIMTEAPKKKRRSSAPA